MLLFGYYRHPDAPTEDRPYRFPDQYGWLSRNPYHWPSDYVGRIVAKEKEELFKLIREHIDEARRGHRCKNNHRRSQ